MVVTGKWRGRNMVFVIGRQVFSKQLELFDLIDGEPRTFEPDQVHKTLDPPKPETRNPEPRASTHFFGI